MATKKEQMTMLSARVPVRLVKAIDRAAQAHERTRTGEIVVRLKESLGLAGGSKRGVS